MNDRPWHTVEHLQVRVRWVLSLGNNRSDRDADGDLWEKHWSLMSVTAGDVTDGWWSADSSFPLKADGALLLHRAQSRPCCRRKMLSLVSAATLCGRRSRARSVITTQGLLCWPDSKLGRHRPVSRRLVVVDQELSIDCSKLQA